MAVLFWHSFPLSYGLKWSTAEPVDPYAPLIASVLPMFFVLSGFLVMGSALRINNLRTFIVFRTLRIAGTLRPDDTTVCTAATITLQLTDPDAARNRCASFVTRRWRRLQGLRRSTRTAMRPIRILQTKKM